ncbi:MAG: hypothetical protein IT292_04335 [Deltaproteobacteria bacterium]|nr:hypothetical protein [Deltaproteobacteria bacterium]
MKTRNLKNKKNERGSLSLEQILFIGAVVGLAAGLGGFYGNLGEHFKTFNPQALQDQATNAANAGSTGAN